MTFASVNTVGMATHARRGYLISIWEILGRRDSSLSLLFNVVAISLRLVLSCTVSSVTVGGEGVNGPLA